MWKFCPLKRLNDVCYISVSVHGEKKRTRLQFLDRYYCKKNYAMERRGEKKLHKAKEPKTKNKASGASILQSG